MRRERGNGCFVFLALLCKWLMALFAAASLLSGAGCLLLIELECCVTVAEKHPLCSSAQAGARPCAWSLPCHQREFGFVSVCSSGAWGLNHICLEFAGSSGTAIKPEEEQPKAWKRQSVSTASLVSHVFGTLEQSQPCFAC